LSMPWWNWLLLNSTLAALLGIIVICVDWALLHHGYNHVYITIWYIVLMRCHFAANNASRWRQQQPWPQMETMYVIIRSVVNWRLSSYLATDWSRSWPLLQDYT
jgi:hypothetical protein